jgi:hypothetical protein
MLFASTTASENLAAIGAISTDVFGSIYGWIIVAVGIPLAFVLARYLISLFKHGVGRSGK